MSVYSDPGASSGGGGGGSPATSSPVTGYHVWRHKNMADRSTLYSMLDVFTEDRDRGNGNNVVNVLRQNLNSGRAFALGAKDYQFGVDPGLTIDAARPASLDNGISPTAWEEGTSFRFNNAFRGRIGFEHQMFSDDAALAAVVYESTEGVDDRVVHAGRGYWTPADFIVTEGATFGDALGGVIELPEYDFLANTTYVLSIYGGSFSGVSGVVDADNLPRVRFNFAMRLTVLAENEI